MKNRKHSRVVVLSICHLALIVSFLSLLFSGCATEFSFPEVGKALIKLLNQLGVEIVFPKEQGCCGIAVFASGDLDTAKEMALHNIAVFWQYNFS